jgi:predicted RNA binding protein YcfA (HicA-like mRNA interferase family)
MTRLPGLKPRVVVRALERAGFTIVRVKGGHYQLYNASTGRRVTVPYHHQSDLSRGTLSAIIQQSGLTADEFLKLT